MPTNYYIPEDTQKNNLGVEGANVWVTRASTSIVEQQINYPLNRQHEGIS